MKFIKNRTALLLFLISALPLIISFVFAPTVSAASDPRDTATKKEWYSIIQACATEFNVFNGNWNSELFRSSDTFEILSGNVANIPPENLRTGNWFAGNRSHTNYASPAVEEAIDGKYEDGRINCGTKDNELVKKGLGEILNLNYREVICNYKTGGQTSEISFGILGQENDNSVSCFDAFDTENPKTYFKKAPANRVTYFDEIVTEKTFNGDVPAGSLYALTDVEYYYVLHDAFITACALGNGTIIEPGHENDLPYVITEKQGNDIVQVGYSKRQSPNENDYVTYFYNNKMTCGDIADALKEGKIVDAYKQAIETGETEGEATEDPTKVEKNCQNSGGAGSLGWIVCSILDWMQSASEQMYEKVVEPALIIEPTLFTEGGELSGALAPWEIFRNFANIIFIILVLMVIFSQLTGFGIDNYGIKKILPKLIIGAILINLSYLICLICVDLSNIVGNGIQDLFNTVADRGISEVTIMEGAEGSQSVNFAADAGIVAASVTFIAVGVVAIYSNPALLLTLFVSVIGLFIALLFIFILLAGRKAAIVLLTVISPVAFILYMLPNTKKIYDKWFNLWKAMLLVYPICGLLIGGGNLASKLMLTVGPNSNAVTAFTAIIVGIVPIFFIPSVIKGAYSAIGSIGGTIAGFGNRMRGGATRGMRNSGLYKNLQKAGQDRKIRKQAGLNKQGDATRAGRLQRRIAGSKPGRFFGADRRLNARTKAAKKEIAEQEEAAATSMEIMAAHEWNQMRGQSDTDETIFKSDRENYYANKFLKAAKKNDRSSMNAALAAAKSAGVRDKDIAKMVRHAENSGALAKMDQDKKSQWLQHQAANNGAFATDAELQSWAASGGKSQGQQVELGDYGEYAKNHMDITDVKKEDVNKLSADSLSGLITSGTIDKGMAQQMLASNPNISNDKRLMLGAAANGLVGSTNAQGVWTSNITASNFKEAATAVAKDTSNANTLVGMSQSMADAIIAPTPQSVNVVQNFQGGGSQENPVEVVVSHSSNPTPSNPTPSGPTPSNPPSNPPAQPTPPSPTPSNPPSGPTPPRPAPSGPSHSDYSTSDSTHTITVQSNPSSSDLGTSGSTHTITTPSTPSSTSSNRSSSTSSNSESSNSNHSNYRTSSSTHTITIPSNPDSGPSGSTPPTS